MTISTNSELLEALLNATKSSELHAILQEIGDQPELTVDEPFGKRRFQWHFYGDSDSNISTINLGSKPGRSLTERITNAIDAVLEKRIALTQGVPTPSSPMEGAKKWFGRPPTTADNGLFNWKDYGTQDYDRLVQVVMTPGDNEVEPTVDIVDKGIGIAPKDFPSTILSLHGGNKLKKFYLVGAFGQGGSSTLRFCDYTIIISRRFDSPETVGFTIVKKMRLAEQYKEDAYVYLVEVGHDGKLEVPSCIRKEAIELYPSVESSNKKPRPFESGTVVRHCGYKLDGFHKTLTSAPGNLYHLFQHMMFDPLIPFRMIDLRRNAQFHKDEIIKGSRNRLMTLVGQSGLQSSSADQEDIDESGTELRHHFPREMISPLSNVEPQIGVEYWVVENREKKKDGTVKLRSRSNSLYVDSAHPIIGTLHGQNQGTDTEQIFRELNLPMVARHIIVHIDATHASKDIRSSLFSSTREAFADGDVLRELKNILTMMLREDEELYEIENELVETIIDRETQEVDQEVKQEITALLRDAGFKVTESGETIVAGEGTETFTAPPHHHRRKLVKPDPLPTLPYPQVTRFEIVYPKDKFVVNQGDNRSIRIETDADYRFGRERKLDIRTEPPKLEIASVGMLQGGRMYWRLRPTADSAPGDIGQVIATITKPGGAQLEARLPYEILAAREEKGAKVKGLVPPFEVVAINPFDEPDQFEKVWLDLDPEIDKSTIAYKAVQLQGKLYVYYSTGFSPYVKQLEKMKLEPSLSQLFLKNYKIWIGYHAMLQWQRRSTQPGMSETKAQELDKLQEQERAVVAEMQVKQALKTAEMQREAMAKKSE